MGIILEAIHKRPRPEIFLSEAFEILDAWLFGEECHYQDIIATEIESPEHFAAKRKPFEEGKVRELELLKSIDQKITRAVDPEQIENLKAQKKESLDRKSKHLETLLQMPEPDESNTRHYEAYQRRQKTEEILISALASGDLMAFSPYSSGIPKEAWKGGRGYKYYIELSFVCVPARQSSQRRFSARIKALEFYDWLHTVKPIVAERISELPAEEQCGIFLVELTKNPMQPMSKQRLIEDCQEKFPGLSRRGFERQWALHAHPRWKEAGRRPGT